MARPTINFQSGGSITNASTTYYFEVQPGVPYIMTLYGIWNGATAQLRTYSEAPFEDVYTVDVEAWTNNAEARFVSPHSVMLLEVNGAGASTQIGVTYTPIRYTVK